jgi:hypothetical protein
MLMNVIEAAGRHSVLHAAVRAIALAPEDKLRAIEDARIRLAPTVGSGELLKCDAIDALCNAARAHGLYSRHRDSDIDYIIGMAVEGIRTLMPPIDLILPKGGSEGTPVNGPGDSSAKPDRNADPIKQRVRAAQKMHGR